MKKSEIQLFNREKMLMIFGWNFEIEERCKGVLSFHFLLFNHFFSSGDSIRVHCVDLGESFLTHIYLQNLASIQPFTSPVKFARSPRTDPPRWVLPGQSQCVRSISTYVGFFQAESVCNRKPIGSPTPAKQDKSILNVLSCVFDNVGYVFGNERRIGILMYFYLWN